jgi:hypothetical protein
MLMLRPATSWQPGGQGLLLVLRLVTNLPSPSQPDLEVPKQYTYTATAMAAMACPDAGPSTRAGAGLTRFICVNCSATGRLSSRWLFLHRAAVRRHISASKACFAADLDYKEIHVEARPGDVGLVGQLVQRRRFVTNLQVQQYIYVITMSCIRTMLLA